MLSVKSQVLLMSFSIPLLDATDVLFFIRIVVDVLPFVPGNLTLEWFYFKIRAICGKKDGRIWAISQSKKNSRTSKKIYEKEKTILEIFENGKKNDIYINNEKFYLTWFDKEEDICYLKKNKGGACIGKSYQCYFVGIYESNGLTRINSGDCNNDIYKFVSKIKKFNF